MLHKLKTLVEHIDEEVMDAQEYAKLAAMLKSSEGDLSRTYHTIAKQELNHIDMLCEQGRRMARDAEGDHKAGVETLWEVTEERTMPWVAKVRLMLDSI